MAHNQNKHEPSFYRGLIREKKSKKGRHPKKLLKEARSIQDPYYASLALLRISDDPRLPISEAKLIAFEALRLAEEESRLWRRAELYGRLAKYAKTWNKEFSEEDSHRLLDEILRKLHVFPKGKGLSQNINEISKHMGCKRLLSLLKIAVQNNDYSLDDSKTVIRQWATICVETISPENIYSVLSTVKNSFIQSKLMGYFYLQCTKKQIEYQNAFNTAIETAIQLKSNEQLKALRYLIRHIGTEQDFLHLKNVISSLPDNQGRTQLLTTLGGVVDRKEYKKYTFSIFQEALEASKQIYDQYQRTKEQIKIAKGLLKINKKDLAKKILVTNHEMIEDKSLKMTIEEIMEQYNVSFNEIQLLNTSSISSEYKTSDLPLSSGHVLALFNTYEGSLNPIHVRTLARAAPLCAGFGLNLWLIDFPITELDNFVKKVTTDTRIGQSGKYVQFLYNGNRIHLYSSSQIKTKTISDDNLLIATTAHPAKDKSITMNEAFIKLENDSKKKIILIMGLGKKGLPTSILQKLRYHLELTGVYVPLETCTAMGIIALKMHEELTHKK